MKGLPIPARVMIGVTGAAGVVLLVWACLSAHWGWPPLASMILAVATGFLRVDLNVYGQNNRASITLDLFADFIVLGLFGLPWMILAVLLASILFGLSHKAALYKTLFNFGGLALSGAVTAALLHAPGIPAVVTVPVAAALFYGMNTGLIAGILSIVTGRPWLSVWRENFMWTALPQVALAVSGFVLGGLVARTGWVALTVALPVPMLHYMYSIYAKASRKHTGELEEMTRELTNTVAAVVDARDPYTLGHSFQVAKYSEAIALQMGYTPEAAGLLRRNALLHDVGKVGIPERILFKPGRLTAEEYDIMKRHPAIGYEMLKNIRPLEGAANVALNHHERWDGTGYPSGVAGEAVALDSRIVCVADCLDTLLSDRPYRRGRQLAGALAEVDRCAGTQFDPEVVAALHRVVAAKDPDFFINSADQVAVAGAGILRWTPAELDEHDSPPAGIEVQGRSPAGAR